MARTLQYAFGFPTTSLRRSGVPKSPSPSDSVSPAGGGGAPRHPRLHRWTPQCPNRMILLRESCNWL